MPLCEDAGFEFRYDNVIERGGDRGLRGGDRVYEECISVVKTVN